MKKLTEVQIRTLIDLDLDILEQSLKDQPYTFDLDNKQMFLSIRRLREHNGLKITAHCDLETQLRDDFPISYWYFRFNHLNPIFRAELDQRIKDVFGEEYSI